MKGLKASVWILTNTILNLSKTYIKVSVTDREEAIMFTINDDKSIYLTRGDIAVIEVGV